MYICYWYTTFSVDKFHVKKLGHIDLRIQGYNMFNNSIFIFEVWTVFMLLIYKSEMLLSYTSCIVMNVNETFKWLAIIF